MSPQHREAFAHLYYGLRTDGGFVLLTGEVGAGKTTLMRCLLAHVPEDLEVAFVLNPRVTVIELLQTVAEELGIELPADPASGKALIDRISRHLLDVHARGRRTVLVIDEAQNLTDDVLEQIRLLTNLETDRRKLLRIILIGQPELAQLLQRPAMRQLSQRITARYHLGGLTHEELAGYVRHRFAVAGSHHHAPFTRNALRVLYQRSRGIPRVVNVIADRALLGAYVEGTRSVGVRLVTRAADEVRGVRAPRRRRLALGGALALGSAVAVGLATLAPTAWPPQAVAPDAPPAAEQAARASTAAEQAARASTAAEVASALPAEPHGASSAEPGATAAPSSPFARASDVTAASAVAEPTPEPEVTAADAGTGSGRVALARADLGPRALEPLWRAREAQSRHEAFARLFEAWHAPIDIGGRDPCEAAPEAGLRCLERDGGWRLLAKLNRPAVLRLREPGNRREGADGDGARYLAVVGLQDGQVDVHVNGERVRLQRRALEPLWAGRIELLWQMPPAYQAPLRQGDSGETVVWLRQRLASALGAPVGDAPRFDRELARRLRDFQRRNDLRADGVAGPHTWIRLNASLDAGVPTLARAGEAGEG